MLVNSKMRFSKVKKHDKIDLVATDESFENIEEGGVVKCQQIIEEELVEAESYSEITQVQREDNLDADLSTLDGTVEIEETQEDVTSVPNQTRSTIDEKAVNPLGVAGLTISILAFIPLSLGLIISPYLWILSSMLFLLAIILSIIALVQIRNEPDRYLGSGFAIAGLVIPVAPVVIAVIVLAAAILIGL
jgi:hypothetical protein